MPWIPLKKRILRPHAENINEDDTMPGNASFPTGIITAAVTPMDRALNPDYPLLVSHCRGLLDAGSNGVVLLGTTGEAASFTTHERMAILEYAVTNGLPAEKVMVGTGCPSFGDTVTLTQHALDLGVRNVLVLPPYYYKQVTEAGVIDYFSKVIESVSSDTLRVYLYHIPQITGIDLTTDMIGKLREAYPNVIAGMKDSGGSWVHTSEMIRLAPEFSVYSGSEEFLLQTLISGGAGSISATANADVTQAATLVDAFLNGQPCEPAQQFLTRLRNAFSGLPLVGALKGFLAVQSGNEQWRYVRPPNTLPEEAVIRLLADRHGKLLAEARSGMGFRRAVEGKS